MPSQTAENLGSHDPQILSSFATSLFYSHLKLSPVVATNAMVTIRDSISFGFAA